MMANEPSVFVPGEAMPDSARLAENSSLEQESAHFAHRSAPGGLTDVVADSSVRLLPAASTWYSIPFRVYSLRDGCSDPISCTVFGPDSLRNALVRLVPVASDQLLCAVSLF